MSTQNVNFDIHGSSELKAFDNCGGGTVDKNKPRLFLFSLKLTRQFRVSSVNTASVRGDVYTNEGWSSKI